jgi:GNAT superfamily N-acetyltransferase
MMRIGESFHSASQTGQHVALCPASLAATLKGLALSESGCLLVGEIDGKVLGVIGGVMFPHWLDAKHIVAQEFFWWCDPEARGTGLGLKLLDAFESFAQANGARTVIMASTSVLAPEKLAKLYQRRGYSPLDVNYSKTLEG